MIQFQILNTLGPNIYFSADNHLLLHSLLESDTPLKNEDFIGLIEDELRKFLGCNTLLESSVYYTINSKSTNTKVLIVLEEDVGITFNWSDGVNDFLSAGKTELINLKKSTIFIMPNSIKYSCDTDSLYSLELQLSTNKKFKKL